MGLKRNNATEASKQFWEGVDRTAARVDAWPSWMKGEVQTALKPAAQPPASKSDSQQARKD